MTLTYKLNTGFISSEDLNLLITHATEMEKNSDAPKRWHNIKMEAEALRNTREQITQECRMAD